MRGQSKALGGHTNALIEPLQYCIAYPGTARRSSASGVTRDCSSPPRTTLSLLPAACCVLRAVLLAPGPHVRGCL